MVSSDSDFNISSKLVIFLVATKLARLAFFINKNRSFMNKLNSFGHNIEPYGTPETNIFNSLSMLFVLTFCFLLFKLR